MIDRLLLDLNKLEKKHDALQRKFDINRRKLEKIEKVFENKPEYTIEAFYEIKKIMDVE